MGLRIRKSINIGKHFKVNLSKSGVGFRSEEHTSELQSLISP